MAQFALFGVSSRKDSLCRRDRCVLSSVPATRRDSTCDYFLLTSKWSYKKHTCS